MSSSSIFDSLYSSYGYSSSRYNSTSSSNYLDDGARRSSAFSNSPYSGTNSYSTTYSSTYSSRYPTSSSSSSTYDYSTSGSSNLGRRRNSNDYKYGIPSSYSASSLSNRSSNSSGRRYGAGLDLISREDATSLSHGPKYDQLGKELSNYDRWKLKSSNQDDLFQDSYSKSRLNSSSLYSKDEDSFDSNKDTFGSLNNYSSSSSALSRIKRGTSILDSGPSSSSYRSSFGSLSSVRSFPSGVADKLCGYDVQDVKGDGGCYYRCLSLFFTGSEDNYMKYRREVMAYIREHLDSYSSMIKSEISRSSTTNDYFNRKMRADRQDWAETTEIIATCCVYNINVHVLALVPGRRSTWEWLHFDPSIGTGKPSQASRDVYLYNKGSVHFMLCKPK